MRRIHSFALLAAVAAGLLGSSPAAHAAPGDILVYAGNAALNQGYNSFAAAAGRSLTTLTTLPASLDQRCVILPINASQFSAAQKTTLDAYVRGGGTLIALAENNTLPAAIATMRDLATHLGSGLGINAAMIDGGFWTTPNIVDDPLTAGVTNFRYAATSEITVSGSGRPLIRTVTGAKTFVATTQIGAGTFVLAGDSNGFSDNSSGAFTGSYGNARFARNLCGPYPTVISVNPAIVDVDSVTPYVVLSARLTTTAGTPVAGRQVGFASLSGLRCTGVTDANGVASCGSVPEVAAVALDGGSYSATFAGDASHAASSGSGKLVRAAGSNLP